MIYHYQLGLVRPFFQRHFKLIALALAGLFVLLQIALLQPTRAASTIIVSDINPMGWSNGDVRPGGAVTYVNDATSPYPGGALQLTTDATNESKSQYVRSESGSINDVTELGYWTRQVGASFSGGTASFQLFVDLDGGDLTTGYATLVYEPYWQNAGSPDQAPVLANIWQEWDVDAGLFWSSKDWNVSNCELTNGAGGPPFYTLTDIKQNCPDTTLLGIGVNVGTYNPDYDILIDGVSFNGTTYDFELPDPFGEIIKPTNGQSVWGTFDLEAIYEDWDGGTDDDSVQWAVRFNSCSTNTNTVAGNVDGNHDDSNWDGAHFAASLDTTGWTEGEYCFVFNPRDDAGQSDVRVTRRFIVTRFTQLECSPNYPYAGYAVSSNQGLLKNNTSVLPERSDSNSSLGAADGNFFSLGFGGSITVEFNGYVVDVPGNDLTFSEVTNGTYPQEDANIEVSKDGVNWHPVGTVNNKGINGVDISSASLGWIKFVKVTDASNSTSFEATADGYDLDAITATNLVCDEPLAEITLCKVDDGRNPLAGWKLMLLGGKIEDVNVPANNPSGSDTSAVLSAGKSYVAIAEGTWENRRSPLNLVDAEYSTEDNWATQMDGFTGYSTDILELQINEVVDPVSDWGVYNSNHRYAQAFTMSVNGNANLRIYDGHPVPNVDNSWYNDNFGELGVSVHEGFAGTTGDDGCVTFEDVPYGEYEIDEIMLDGWENVSGLDEVTIDGDGTFEVVNREVTNGDDQGQVGGEICDRTVQECPTQTGGGDSDGDGDGDDNDNRGILGVNTLAETGTQIWLGNMIGTLIAALAVITSYLPMTRAIAVRIRKK